MYDTSDKSMHHALLYAELQTLVPFYQIGCCQ